MKQHDLALRFLIKAAQDEHLVDTLATDRTVADEILGFHCQQAAEKLLKAVLVDKDLEFERSHNLVYLMGVLEDAGYAVPGSLRGLDILNPFAVTLRYDFLDVATSLDRLQARSLVAQLRQWVEAQVAG